MRGTNLNFIRLKDLRKTILALNRTEKVTMWPRERCVRWLTEKYHIDEINVGDFCRLLLRVVVGKNKDGYAIGLSYHEMFKIVKCHFPHSAVNLTHFSFYATTMRSRGEIFPVYREPS